MTLYLQRHHKD
ncbi:hypothetical protein Bhyg_03724 [Pseudolycoriella hygida]|uniref:Uncharacterized protein n=1 Tax=Pseudolycoriella hygida TaxID=35572 RepID=A0A9Q0NDX2_9DIPT|nr:hypothetical protein Bhyg_03724 [Pseudolycoriella hygida]